MNPKTVLAWHFLREDGKLAHLDIEPPPDGVTLQHDGPVVLCESGLHASRSLRDALSYAHGPALCRVRMGGTIFEGDDKLVSSERTIIWRIDAQKMNRVLRLLACWCIRNTKLADGRTVWDLLDDPRSRTAVETAERFAHGAATADELAAAYYAAYYAAHHAAYYAADRAAYYAAHCAAYSDAHYAANSAAYYAAHCAAFRAADKQLLKMVMQAHLETK